MDVILAVELWRNLVLIGHNFTNLRCFLISQNKLNLVSDIEMFEMNSHEWFSIFDPQLSVPNIDLSTFDLKEISTAKLIEKLLITEDYFDFINFDLNQISISFIQMSESLIYFSMDCEKEKIDLEYLNLIEENQNYIEHLIELVEDNLENNQINMFF